VALIGMSEATDRVVLTGRAGVDRVVLVPVGLEVPKRVTLDELVARIAGLRGDVDSRDEEPGALVAAGCATGAAEQVEQARRLLAGGHHVAASAHDRHAHTRRPTPGGTASP